LLAEANLMETRPATRGDAEVLTQIAHAAKRHWGYPERWIELWREALTLDPEVIAGNPFIVATEGERAVGFYGLLPAADGAWVLEHLWLRPEAMGKGVGRALFADAVARARQGGAATLEIDADPNAEGFYRRMGAEKVGEVVGELDGQRRARPLLRLLLAAAPEAP
jgi:GNAT superfamily N-acetyltransferase